MDIKPHAVPSSGELVEQKQSYPLGKKGDGFVTDSKIEPPLSLYEKMKGEPYTIRYFGLTDWLQLSKMPQFDASGLLGKVSDLEGMVIKEMQRRNLEDSPEAYRSIMKEIREKLQIHPLEKGHIVFDKILSFFMKYRNKTAYGIR